MPKVKELLSDESKWCKRTYARDANDVSISADSDAACSFCLLGAIHRCYQIGSIDVIKRVRTKLQIESYETVGTWNDNRNTTFADVKALVEELDI